MLAFRVLLVSLIGIVIAYTGIVVGTQGWDFGSVFFDAILAMKWPGQFNLDFSCLLLLAGLWLAWRHHFSALGVALGLLVLVGGTPLLCTYLLVASVHAAGDAKVLLLGTSRAAA